MSGVQLQNKNKSCPLDFSAKFDNYKVTTLIRKATNKC